MKEILLGNVSLTENIGQGLTEEEKRLLANAVQPGTSPIFDDVAVRSITVDGKDVATKADLNGINALRGEDLSLNYTPNGNILADKALGLRVITGTVNIDSYRNPGEYYLYCTKEQLGTNYPPFKYRSGSSAAGIYLKVMTGYGASFCQQICFSRLSTDVFIRCSIDSKDWSNWEKLGINCEGTFKENTQYHPNDIVFYKGSSYICKKANVSQNPLSTDNFQILAQGVKDASSITGNGNVITDLNIIDGTISVTKGIKAALEGGDAAFANINLTTLNNSLTLPQGDGTLAKLSDIPNVSGLMPKTGGTFSGPITAKGVATDSLTTKNAVEYQHPSQSGNNKWTVGQGAIDSSSNFNFYYHGSGKIISSVKSDGTFLINNKDAATLVSDGSYIELADSKGITLPGGYLRTPISGLIPNKYNSGGSIGTDGWRFSSAYINNIYGNLNGSATLSSLNVNGNATATKFSGSGEGITNIKAENITSGRISTERLGGGTANSSTYLKGDYSWSGLNADDIIFGRVSQYRLGEGTANSSTYLRGDGKWASIIASGATASTKEINLSIGATFATADFELLKKNTTTMVTFYGPKFSGGSGAFYVSGNNLYIYGVARFNYSVTSTVAITAYWNGSMWSSVSATVDGSGLDAETSPMFTVRIKY